MEREVLGISAHQEPSNDPVPDTASDSADEVPNDTTYDVLNDTIYDIPNVENGIKGGVNGDLNHSVSCNVWSITAVPM